MNTESTDQAAPDCRWLCAPFSIVILLHALGVLFPSHATWGFNFWSVFDSSVALVVLGIVLLLTLPPIARVFTRSATVAIDRLNLAFRQHCIFMGIGAVLVVWAVLYALRSQALIYGDGYEVLRQSSEAAGLFEGLADVLMHPLSVVASRIAVLLGSQLGLSSSQALGLLNSLAGAVGVAALFCISRLLFNDTKKTALLFLISLTGGTTILFAGHVEYYTLAIATALWSLYFSLKCAGGSLGYWPGIGLALLAMLFHMVTAPFLIVAVLAIVMRSRVSIQTAITNRPSVVVLSTVGLVAISVGLLQFATGTDMFVSVVPPGEGNYWTLSPAHLLDILNASVLLAPIGFILLLTMPLWRRTNTLSLNNRGVVLLAVALLTFLAAFFIDPKLGAPRDFDLLAVFGIPLSIFATYLFLLQVAPGKSISLILIPALVVLVVHIAPNLHEKHYPQIAAVHLDRMLADDAHYQIEYLAGDRGVSWGTILTREENRPDLAAKYFRRRINGDDTDSRGWSNLGEVFYLAQQYDSAGYFYQQAIIRDSSIAYYWFRLAETESRSDHPYLAGQLIQKAASLAPENPRIQFAAGVILSAADEPATAIEHYRAADRLDPQSSGAVCNIASLYLKDGALDSACVYFKQALTKSPTSIRIHEHLIFCLISMGRLDEARNHLPAYRQLSPDMATLRRLDSAITAGLKRPTPSQDDIQTTE